MEETIKPKRRKPFLRWVISIIVGIIALPFVLITVYLVTINWAMTHWLSTDIKLPDGSGRVKFMVRAGHPLVAEFNRQIRIETKSFPSTTLIAPIDTCGATPVDVYWYPANKQEGPYLRLIDPLNEYVIDLKHGGIRQMARIDFRLYVGKCTDDISLPAVGSSISNDGKEYVDFGHIDSPVPKATGLLVESDGHYIGSVDYGALGCRFRKTKPSVSWQDRDDL